MGIYGLTISAPISADVARYKAAVLDGVTGAAAVAGAKAKALGIFTEDVTLASGMQAGIQTERIAPALYGAAASYMDSLTPDAQGRMVPATGNTGDRVWCVGYAFAPGAQAGDIGEVLVHPHQVVIGASGPVGKSFLAAAGAPAAGTGADGDVYLNITNGDLYGPKANGAWGAKVATFTLA